MTEKASSKARTEFRLYDPLAGLVEPLERLPEGSLLALIGSLSLTPAEQSSAALRQHAPAELDILQKEGLIVEAPVDLVMRGRETIRRVLEEWGDELREKICPLRAKKGVRRTELIANIAAALAAVLSAGAGAIAVIAVFLARFSLDELCDGWREPRSVTVKFDM